MEEEPRNRLGYLDGKYMPSLPSQAAARAAGAFLYAGGAAAGAGVGTTQVVGEQYLQQLEVVQ